MGLVSPPSSAEVALIMDFDRTYTESELDPAALEFARSLRERPAETPGDMSIDAFGESLGARLLRLFRGRKD